MKWKKRKSWRVRGEEGARLLGGNHIAIKCDASEGKRKIEENQYAL